MYKLKTVKLSQSDFDLAEKISNFSLFVRWALNEFSNNKELQEKAMHEAGVGIKKSLSSNKKD